MKKSFKRLSVLAVLLAASVMSVSAALGLGMDVYSGGYVIPHTPFDFRVRQAGIFEVKPPLFMPAPDEKRSIEDLFATARSFRYTPDPKGDYWQTADESERRHAGDCEDKAVWLFARLIQNGYYNVRLVIGRYREIDNNLHVWVICSDKNGNTCLLDPAIQKRIWYLTATDSQFYHPLYAYDFQNRYRYSVNY